jgi:mannose-6-phosphate isomerase-like protein (cupin superfamily)
MIVRNLEQQTPFTTKDGSTITSILDASNAPVQNHSLAEATLLADGDATQRHYHKLSEESYFIVAGSGVIEINGETREVKLCDAILIPPGAWHTIRATGDFLRFLCCCAPPYSHEDTYFE